MKKKLFTCLLLIISVLCLAVCFSACDDKEEGSATKNEIISVNNATITDKTIYLLVDNTTTSVSLSGEVVCSENYSWQLYASDSITEIPTKVIISLADGANTYYLVVTSTLDNTVSATYILTVYKSFAVTVDYYNGDDIIKSETAYTGYYYSADYVPDITGYTFNNWYTADGQTYSTTTILEDLNLYADTTANAYTITYNANEGTLSETETTITYNSIYTLAIPERAGYSFNGWYYDETQFTDENGNSISEWNYTENITVTAHWTIQYIVKSDNILLLESNSGEAEDVITTIESGNYNVTVFTASVKTTTFRQSSTVTEIQEFPNTLDELANYSQVILVNIAYSDLPTGFEEILYTYVYDLGGGLLTIGGENELNSTGDTVSHAYNQSDLLNSSYLGNMLPVDVVDGYTPPAAVMFVVDRSGSMTKDKITQTITGALACLDTLNTSDYVGIIEFGSTAKVTLSMTSVVNKSVITAAINNIGNDTSIGSGTSFSQALSLAGTELSNAIAAFKHIILITDGMPNDNGAYQQYIENNYNTYGITMSVVGIQLSASAYALMLSDVALCGCEGQVLNATETSEITSFIQQSFKTNVTDKINSVKDQYPDIDQFTPEITDNTSSVVTGITQDNMPVLYGYYSSVLKTGATAVLVGEYNVPIYAQWSYGAGKVGSFLCSFNSTDGSWSSDFSSSSYGKQFLLNVVSALMPENS